MPIGWTTVGTPEELRLLLTDPPEFERRVEQLVKEAGASVGHIAWTARGGPAVILTHIPNSNATEILAELVRNLGPTTVHYTLHELELRFDEEQ